MDGDVPYTFLIRHLQLSLEKKMAASLLEIGLTVSQVGALRAILTSNEQQLSLKQLEKHMGLSQSVTAGILTRMELKGLVTSHGDPKDRRVKIYEVTELGKVMCQKARERMEKTEKEFLSCLEPPQQEQLRLLLQQLLANQTSPL